MSNILSELLIDIVMLNVYVNITDPKMLIFTSLMIATVMHFLSNKFKSNLPTVVFCVVKSNSSRQ